MIMVKRSYPESGFFKFRILSFLLLGVCTFCLQAQDSPFGNLSEKEQLSEDILRELVGYETTVEKPGETRSALQAMANRLAAAGFSPDDIQLLNPKPASYGLLVRYRGIGEQKPMHVLAHIDVVTAVADDWAFPPFSLGEQDGYYLGRGTDDNKAGVTQIVSNFIRLRQEGWIPGRDVIAVISGDEETSQDFANWAATEEPQLAVAEYALNTDAGGGEYDEGGNPLAFWIQTSEKLYQTYQLTTRNSGGHSSQPRPDNAIRDLAIAITRLTDYQFPIQLNDTTRTAFRRSASLYDEEIARDMRILADNGDDAAAADRLSAADPAINATMRTTCVPTMLDAGHAENALPRDASVTVNCRILPGTPAVEIEKVIAGMVDGLGVEISIAYEGVASDVSDLPDAMLEQIETLVEEQWGQIPVIPGMSTGATDGLFFRNAGIPVFGMSALFSKPGSSGAHGLDEKIGITAFHESVEFWYQLLKLMAK
jgi:acetylornithine deacetylase/succinyl-diaminopimelate desuccinylase-like protein